MLSDFIVKNRGIIPKDAKTSMASLKETEDIIMSCWAACVETDTEGDSAATPLLRLPFKYFTALHCLAADLR